MKINKKALEEMVHALRVWNERMQEDIQAHLQEMERAKTAEQAMKCKQDVLRTMARLPLSTRTCYFCQLHRKKEGGLDCAKCEYATTHGMCGVTHSDNDYGTVVDALDGLGLVIDSRYYRGEKYRKVRK